MELAAELVGLGNIVDLVSRRSSKSQITKESIRGVRIHRFSRPSIVERFSTYDRLSGPQRTSVYSSVRGSILGKVYSVYLRSIDVLRITAKIVLLARDRKWDVILERETSWGAGALAAKLLGLKYYLEMVGPVASPLCVRWAEKVFANTRGVVGEDLPADTIVVLSAGVNIRLFSGASCSGNSLAIPGSYLVGYFGGFLEFHGVGTILGCMGRVTRETPETRFLFVGPYYADALNSAECLGTVDHAIFLGAVPYDSIPGLMACCDILLAPYNPSASELTRTRGLFGSPIKVFESMASGRPIVATCVGTVPEILHEARCGVLVPPDSPQELAEAILGLLGHPKCRKKMGKRGQISAKRYTWSSVAERIHRHMVQGMM